MRTTWSTTSTLPRRPTFSSRSAPTPPYACGPCPRSPPARAPPPTRRSSARACSRTRPHAPAPTRASPPLRPSRASPSWPASARNSTAMAARTSTRSSRPMGRPWRRAGRTCTSSCGRCRRSSSRCAAFPPSLAASPPPPKTTSQPSLCAAPRHMPSPARNTRQVSRERAHLSEIRRLSFSPDGSTLASCSLDASVRLWSASALSPIGVLSDAHLGKSECRPYAAPRVSRPCLACPCCAADAPAAARCRPVRPLSLTAATLCAPATNSLGRTPRFDGPPDRPQSSTSCSHRSTAGARSHRAAQTTRSRCAHFLLFSLSCFSRFAAFGLRARLSHLPRPARSLSVFHAKPSPLAPPHARMAIGRAALRSGRPRRSR